MTTTINITYTNVTIHLSHVQHLFIVITKMLIADGAEHRETYGCVNRVIFWAMKNILYTPIYIFRDDLQLHNIPLGEISTKTDQTETEEIPI